MTVEDAYKIVVRNELQAMDCNLTTGEFEALVAEIADSEDFCQQLGFVVQDAVQFWSEELKIILYKEEE